MPFHGFLQYSILGKMCTPFKRSHLQPFKTFDPTTSHKLERDESESNSKIYIYITFFVVKVLLKPEIPDFGERNFLYYLEVIPLAVVVTIPLRRQRLP